MLNIKQLISFQRSHRDIPRVLLLEFTGSSIAEVKDFTQPCGVTDEDRH